MPVTRCVCHNVPFEQLREITAREGLGFQALRERTRCASACGMCEPYIRVMLSTGQTSFKLMRPATVARVLAEGRCADAGSLQNHDAGQQNVA